MRPALTGGSGSLSARRSRRAILRGHSSAGRALAWMKRSAVRSRLVHQPLLASRATARQPRTIVAKQAKAAAGGAPKCAKPGLHRNHHSPPLARGAPRAISCCPCGVPPLGERVDPHEIRLHLGKPIFPSISTSASPMTCWGATGQSTMLAKSPTSSKYGPWRIKTYVSRFNEWDLVRLPSKRFRKPPSGRAFAKKRL